MRSLVLTICIAAVLVNAAFVIIDYRPDNDDEENGGGGDDDVEPEENEFSLGEEKIIKINGSTHTITILSIDENNVRIRIESDPIEVILSLGIVENVNTDDDDYYDLELNVTDIDDEDVTIEFRPIHIQIGGVEDIPFWVEMPERNFGDDYRYDFTLFAQMYWKDNTTGNYSKYTITGNGQWDEKTLGPTKAESGYTDDHDVARFQRNLAGSFILSLDSHDTDKISVGGTFSADNNDYLEFEEKKVIKSLNHGELSVDKLPKATTPVPIEYVANLRYYPDPYEERMPTLDEKIYEGENISEGDTGSFLFEGSSEYNGGYYNWTAEDVENVAKIPSLRLNITTKVWNFLDFKKLVWISGEAPFPTKEFVRTNSSYEDDNGTWWMILETERTLVGNPTRGTTTIPWKEQGSAVFPDYHPEGEYLNWDKIPKGGYMFNMGEEDAVNDELPIHMSPEYALEFALGNSDDLADFMKANPAAYVTNAAYNATLQQGLDPQKNEGSHYWNLTLKDWIKYNWEDDDNDDEGEDRKRPEHRYGLRVAKNITWNKNPMNPYSAEVEVDKDYGQRAGWAKFKRDEIDKKGLTLSGAVDILENDEVASGEFFDLSGELDMKDLEIKIGERGTSADMPGAEIIQLITGITMPHSKSVWEFKKGSVYQSGDTFTVGMDIETGRLVYVMEVSGNQIMGLFS